MHPFSKTSAMYSFLRPITSPATGLTKCIVFNLRSLVKSQPQSQSQSDWLSLNSPHYCPSRVLNIYITMGQAQLGTFLKINIINKYHYLFLQENRKKFKLVTKLSDSRCPFWPWCLCSHSAVITWFPWLLVLVKMRQNGNKHQSALQNSSHYKFWELWYIFFFS